MIVANLWINQAKEVTFDAMVTLERQNYSIDKLTSLVSKMNVKMGRKETPYKPRILSNQI